METATTEDCYYLPEVLTVKSSCSTATVYPHKNKPIKIEKQKAQLLQTMCGYQDVFDSVGAKPFMLGRVNELKSFPIFFPLNCGMRAGRSFHHTQRHSPSEYKGLQWSYHRKTQHVASNYTDICLAIKVNTSFLQTLFLA